MKFPTIMLGIPHLSLRIVNEKQQLMKPSSIAWFSSSFLAVTDPFEDVEPKPTMSVNGLKNENKHKLDNVALLTMGLLLLPAFKTGLYRKTHEVKTAFWLESNATWPYF